MSRIRLVTRADDLGSFSGAAPAAIDAYRRGFVRNASVMVNTPWFADAARQLRMVPGLCVGVHLTISCEWDINRWRPVSPPEAVPCLVDDDGYLTKDVVALHHRGVALDQLLRECQAQVDRARAYGLEVRYVDTHCGWQWVHAPSGPPRMSELLPAWCARQGLIWEGAVPQIRLATEGTERFARRLIEGAERARPGLYFENAHPCWSSYALASEALGGGPGAIARVREDDAADYGDPLLARELERRGVEFMRYDQVAAV